MGNKGMFVEEADTQGTAERLTTAGNVVKGGHFGQRVIVSTTSLGLTGFKLQTTYGEVNV